MSDEPIMIPCPDCGHLNPKGTTWCPNCGAGKLPYIPPKPRTVPSGLILIFLLLIPLGACGGCLLNDQVEGVAVALIVMCASVVVAIVLAIYNAFAGRL